MWRCAAGAATAMLSVLGVRPAAAQTVGRLPDQSPFADVEGRQTLTMYSGWLRVGADPAGVAPRSAPLIGLRYDFMVGSAGSIYFRGATSLSDRFAIDPLRAVDQRSLGKFRWPVSMIDAGFNMALTGKKSFHGFQPSVSLGVGAVTDLMFSDDIGGYTFGTGLALTYGTGLRYLVSDRWSVRLEATDVLHKLRYPDSYFSGTTPVLTDTRSRSFWRHNIAWQFGLQYAVFR